MKLTKMLLLLIGLLFVTCTNDSKISGGEGTASETVGILYKSDFALADDATILIIAENAIAMPNSPAGTDTMITDSIGQFDLSSLSDGVYNIFGEQNGYKSFLKSIAINNSDDISDTVRDTLGAPGNLAGIVRHEYHNDSRYIIGLMPGSGRFFVPFDSTGVFALEDLAAGIYDIRLISLLDGYLPKDTILSINAGANDTLTDTLFVEFGDIAPVSGLAATYDSLMQVVSLIWNKADSVEAYNIYRTLKGENQKLITSSPVTDTFYNDSTVAVDAEYTYTVAGVKTGVSGSQSSGIVVNTVSLYDSVKTVGSQGSDSIQFNMVGGMAVYKDSLLYVCDVANQRIKVMNDTLGIVQMIPTAGFPFDVTIFRDSALFIVDYANATVHSYSLTGEDYGVVANLSTNNYLKLSADKLGNIYTYNADNKSVDVFKTNGTLDTSLTDTITLKNPYDIGVDGNNNLHVLSGETNAHSVYDTSHTIISVDTTTFIEPKGFFNISNSNEVAIIEKYSGKILFIDEGGISQRINISGIELVSLGIIKNSIVVGLENSLLLYKK